MKLNQKGFGVVEGLLLIIALTLIIGVSFYVVNVNKDKNNNNKDSVSTQPASASNDTNVKKNFLEFKDDNVKLELTDEIKDAYHGATKDDGAYISTKYFDNLNGFEGCKVDGKASGIAALASAKVGDDHFGSPWTEENLKSFSSVKIGDTYYWIEAGNGPCWDVDKVNENSPELKKLQAVRKALVEQGSKITKL